MVKLTAQQKKNTLFLVPLAVLLIATLFFYFIVVRVRPNDKILTTSDGVALFANENPTFNVQFGDKENPGEQWVRFEAQSSNDNPFLSEEKKNIFTMIGNIFKPAKKAGIEMSLRGVDFSETKVDGKAQQDEEIQKVADILRTEEIKTSTVLAEMGREIGKNDDDQIISKQTIINQGVADGIDLEYQILTGLGLKEEIVINDLEAYRKSCDNGCKLPLNEFVFDLKMDEGVSLKNGWYTIEGKSTETYYFVDSRGKYLAHFLPNYAIDDSGEKTYNVNLEVSEKSNGNYEVKVTVASDWLLDENRVYPIRIDPSIVHDDTSDFSGGIFNRTESVTGPKIQINLDNFSNAEYISSVLDFGSNMLGATMSWTPSGVATGNGETPYSTTGMIAQWDFNATSGITAVSGGTCGTSCNGTLTSMTTTGQDAATGTGWTANNKRWGAGAVMFDGTNDYVTTSLRDSTGYTAMSVETWVKTDSTTASIMVAQWKGLMLFLNRFTTGKVFIGFDNSSMDNSSSNESSTSVNDGRWHHIVGTNNGTLTSIYIDGVLENTYSDTLLTGSQAIVLGSNAGTGGFYRGIIDSTRVYNRVLADTEILSNYQSGNIEFQYRTSTDNSTWSDWTSYDDGGLMFDGINDYVDVGTTPTTGTGSFTLEAWIKTVVSGTAKRIISYGDTATNTGLTFLVNANNKVQFSLANTTGPESAATVTDGNWHHVVAVNTAGTIQLYVDGAASGSSMAMTPNISSTSTNRIGVNIDATAAYFDGIMDSVKVYSRALDASEISTNYAVIDGESPASSSGLVGYWKLNETSGSTAANFMIGGFAFDGTLTNFADTTGRDALSKSGWTSQSKRGSDSPLNSLDNTDQNWTTDLNLYQTAGPLVTVAGGVDLGSGKDGACSVTTGTVNISTASCSGRGTADAIGFASTVSTASGSTNIVVSTTPTGLAVGDEILIMNMQGTSTVTVGLYETHIITSISSYTLGFSDYPLKYTYNGTTQKIVVQRIPNYTSVSISSGAVLTANGWDGTKWGVMFFRANGTVTNSGTISMDAKGYVGGIGGPSGAGSGGTGRGGESFCGNPGGGGYNTFNATCGGGAGAGIANGTVGVGTATGGGGGGGGLGGGDPAYGGGGAGGGYGTPGSVGGGAGSGVAGGINVSGNGGAAGANRGGGGGGAGTYGMSTLSKLYMGSGAGGGGAIWGATAGGNGGAGGGIIYISCNSLSNGGVGIVSRGGTGGNYQGSGSYVTGPGGGGAGGSIKIESNTLSLGTNLILATGGSPGAASGYGAGAGGSGRIAVSYASSISGSVSSPLALVQKYSSVVKSEGVGSVEISTGSNVFDPNVVGLWHFEETGGTSAYIKDSSGLGNNGTPTGTVYSSEGKVGGARNYDTGTTRIDIGTPPPASLNFTTTAFTTEAWIKISSLTTANYITSCDNGSVGWSMSVNTSGTLQLTTRGTTDDTTYGTTVLSTGQWYHVAAVYTGTSGQRRLYINGVLEASENYTGSITTSTVAFTIGNRSTTYFRGLIDEVRISNIARTANEIAEAYSIGSGAYVNMSVQSIDFSTKTTIPIDIAADRPGTYLSTTWGESAFANYQPSVNTVGLWHMEEVGGTGAYIKDISGNNNGGTPTAATFISSGKLGGARSFNGTSAYISMADADSLSFSTSSSTFTISAWILPTSLPVSDKAIFTKYNSNNGTMEYAFVTYGDQLRMYINEAGNSTNYVKTTTDANLALGVWQHVVVTVNMTTDVVNLYKDSVLLSGSSTGTYPTDIPNLGALPMIGAMTCGAGTVCNFWSGSMDEVNIATTDYSADVIRQAYEVGLRTHNITVEFGAGLASGNLITGSGDYSFSIDATKYGLADLGSGVYVGDKIIVKENYDGTEYAAQGLVSAVTSSTGAVTVSSWDSGSTFPSGGYTVNADVFKWQREYISTKNRTLSTQSDATTLLSFKLLDGVQGRNIWIDNLRSSTGSLTNSASEVLTFGVSSRYMQYKTIFTSSDGNVTPYLSQVQVDYQSAAPTMDQVMRHGKWFGADGRKSFWWVGTH